jgi:hypothetical protein
VAHSPACVLRASWACSIGGLRSVCGWGSKQFGKISDSIYCDVRPRLGSLVRHAKVTEDANPVALFTINAVPVALGCGGSGRFTGFSRSFWAPAGSSRDRRFLGRSREGPFLGESECTSYVGAQCAKQAQSRWRDVARPGDRAPHKRSILTHAIPVFARLSGVRPHIRGPF